MIVAAEVGSITAAAFIALAVVIAARSGAPLPLDTVVHQWAVAHRSSVLTTAAVAVTSTGTGAVAYGLAAASGAVFVGRRRWWQGALAAGKVAAVGWL